MASKDITVSLNTVWLLIIINIVIGTIGALAKINNWNYADMFLMISIIFFFTYWIIVFSDIVKNKLHNKMAWYFLMLLLPAVAPIAYLIVRERIIEA